MEEYTCACGTTGKENFYKYKYRCKACWNKSTYAASRKNLDTLREERGNACEECGYNKCLNALQWHHLDPTQKEFGISSKRGKPLAQLRDEVAKCKLLCANCHIEKHN